MSEKVTILIVDDEEELLEIYTDFFASEGLKVFSALSAEKALEIYKDNQNEIQVIISDANMKGMNGAQFLEILRRDFSNKPLFYLSTGDVSVSEIQIKKMGGNRLILKPFELDDILENIRCDLAAKK